MPVLQTKLFIPYTHAECIPRPQLIAKLNDGLPRKLTLLSAPAGFGKTTLLVDWITQLQAAAGATPAATPRVCWLSLDDDDNQLARFFTYLIAALQTVEERWGETAVALLQSPQPLPPSQLVTFLINDLARSEPEAPVVLVLDDYHVIRNQDIHQALTFLLKNAPRGLHLAITTRSDPPLPLSQMRVRREMTEIREAELRFTLDETRSFLNRTQVTELPDEEVSVLAARTEGWIAALQLAGLALQSQARDQQAAFVASFGGAFAHVVDYLLDEVWRHQPEEVRAFWLATSILNQLSGSLCDALTGRADSQQLLADLHRRNLFLVPLDNEHRWYRYHRLFSDMLRARAAEQGAATIRRQHRQAADWYEAQQDLPQAIHHALAADELAGATRLIGLASEAALLQGNVATIQGWLDALPESHVRGHHRLALARAWVAYFNGGIETTVDFVTAAQQNWPDSEEPSQKISLLSLQTLLTIMKGDHQSAVALAQEALAVSKGGQHNLHGLLFMNLMNAQAAIGDIDGAVATGHEAVHARFELENAFLAGNLRDGLIQLLMLQGKFQDAIYQGEAAAEQFVDRWNQPLPVAGQLYISLGQAYYERGELDRARSLTLQGIDLGGKLAATMVVVRGKLNLAQIETLRGEDERALLAEVEKLPLPDQFRLIAGAVAAGANLRQGNIPAAVAWADGATMLNTATPIAGLEMVYLTYARCLLADQRWEEADALLDRLAAISQEQNRLGSLIPIIVVQALSQQSQAQSARAKETLRQALLWAEPESHRRPFLEALPELMPLLQALRTAAEPFVASLLGHATLPAPAAARAALPEPLSEREMDILRLIYAGRSNPEIASELYLSTNTVKWYVKQIFQKLQVSSRREAADNARDLGLL